jgi:hypothetical protein
MNVLADGMNLDRNTRCLLAAFDSSTLEDFYLMSNADFSELVSRAKARNSPLPPLQIRKIQMLRRWIKEVVDDHLAENEDPNGKVKKRRNVRLIPKDWKEQYKNDLPHLKLQLRQQGDSIFEKIKTLSEVISTQCGAQMVFS